MYSLLQILLSVLLYNRQDNKFVINNQSYCIIIRFIMYIATCFDPAGSFVVLTIYNTQQDANDEDIMIRAPKI
jgi:hypothetical protein